MNIVHSFKTPPSKSFPERFEVDEIINIPLSHTRNMILKCLDDDTSEYVAIRCLPNIPATHYEIQLLYKIEEMRRTLERSIGAEFVTTFSHCLIEDPFITYKKELDDYIGATEDVQRKKVLKIPPYTGQGYYAIVMDLIDNAIEDGIKLNEMDVLCIGFELFYTIWIARRDFRFYHGDLHVGNVLLNETETKQKRKYVVGGSSFLVQLNYIPVIIDFEKSVFDTPERIEFLSDVNRITSLMAELFQKYGIPRGEAFSRLYELVRRPEFKDTDNRFNPQNVENILKGEVFHPLLVGEQLKSNPKKTKLCIHCNIEKVKWRCDQCGVAICSEACFYETHKAHVY